MKWSRKRVTLRSNDVYHTSNLDSGKRKNVYPPKLDAFSEARRAKEKVRRRARMEKLGSKYNINELLHS